MMPLWGREKDNRPLRTPVWGAGARLAPPGWRKVAHAELPAPETERAWWCQLGVPVPAEMCEGHAVHSVLGRLDPRPGLDLSSDLGQVSFPFLVSIVLVK